MCVQPTNGRTRLRLGLLADTRQQQVTWKIRFGIFLRELPVLLLYTFIQLCCTAAWYASMAEHFPTFLFLPNENRMGERLTWLDVNAAMSEREFSYLVREKKYSRSHCWGSHASCVMRMRTGCSADIHCWWLMLSWLFRGKAGILHRINECERTWCGHVFLPFFILHNHVESNKNGRLWIPIMGNSIESKRYLQSNKWQ